MVQAVIILALLLPMAMVAVFLLTRNWYRRQYLQEEVSPVSRQHIDLFQGGQLNESAVESAKARFRELLERGEVAAVEASLRAGMLYVIQVRALTELGTEDAGRILERQLHRRQTTDPLEQSWYWIDLASGLRNLNRAQSLPHLLRCAEAAGDIPLGHVFAAETICFLGFSGYLNQSDTTLGRSALRVLHRALEGLRAGIQPGMIPEARVGELIETLWDKRSDRVDPLVVRVFAEALRLVRRHPHAEAYLGAETSELEAFRWQMSRLTSLDNSIREYLESVIPQLCMDLQTAPFSKHKDILLALNDLRADAGETILGLIDQPRYPHFELAVDQLTWSKDPRVSPFLIRWVLDRAPVQRRSQQRRRALAPRRPSLAIDREYRAILKSFRGHPSKTTEDFLLIAAFDWDPVYRANAVSSLGWWEPIRRDDVLETLQDARRDPNPEVRHVARSALARLGERQALQWFRQSLFSEDPHRVFETIHAIATESLTLLWPDLDRLADAEDSDLAQQAREALERLSEEMDHYRG